MPDPLADRALHSHVQGSKDRDELLTFYRLCPFSPQTVSRTVGRFADQCELPAPHLQSIRTLNPIESAFATIRHRTKRT